MQRHANSGEGQEDGPLGFAFANPDHEYEKGKINMKQIDATQTEPVLVPANGGTVLQAFGDQFTVKLATKQTAGALILAMDVVPPGGGPPLHYHLHEDELFILQEGRISYYVQDRWTELGPGGVVFAPRGSLHMFRNTGQTPARHYVLMTPSGFENFFSRCADEFAKPGGPDRQRLLDIGAEHGIHFVDQSAVPEPLPNAPTPGPQSDDEAAVAEIVQQLERAWNAGDSASFASHFKEDADFVDILGRHHQSRAAVQAGHREIFETIYRGSRNQYVLEGARFVRPDVVVAFVRSTLLSRLGDAVDDPGRAALSKGELREAQARPTLILEKQNGQWKIAAFQNTKIAQGSSQIGSQADVRGPRDLS
jgi:uncharacterized protein (TIGR02246 family)